MMRRLPFAIVVMASLAGGRAAGAAAGGACEVIAWAVAARMGASAVVTSCVVDDGVAAGPFLAAHPDAAARLGAGMWFTLQRAEPAAAPVRVRAALTVEVAHGRATHLLPRGTVVAAGDVQAVRAAVEGVPFARLPEAAELLGARVIRVVDAGAVMLTRDVAPARVVQAGDRVVATVRIGAVEVSAAVTAVDAGAVGDTIRVSNRDTRRVMRARVAGPGRVEVMYER